MTAISAPISIDTDSIQRGDFVGSKTPVRTSGPIITLFQAIFTLGLLPLVLWPTRWAEFLETERHDLLSLIAWWRCRVMPDEAAKLDKITNRLHPRPILIVLPWLAVSFNVVLIALLMAQGDKIDRIWDLMFKHALENTRQQSMWGERTTLPLEHPLYSVWIGTLCFAYGIQWYAVRSHAVAVQSLVKWTNKLARQYRFTRLRNNAREIGMRPLWIITGVALCAMHAWWAIPMIFAGALQQRYITQTSSTIRLALAEQAREAAVAHAGPNRFCRCGERLPGPAKFCPRCGTAV